MIFREDLSNSVIKSVEILVTDYEAEYIGKIAAKNFVD